mmetsp:Transcript_88080/g.247623  ORF Transcript_88080/g.247623 Transcript_88080/m.247623 type:complete len:263 (-) Transcript_88080:453-1241(-)
MAVGKPLAQIDRLAGDGHQGVRFEVGPQQRKLHYDGSQLHPWRRRVIAKIILSKLFEPCVVALHRSLRLALQVDRWDNHRRPGVQTVLLVRVLVMNFHLRLGGAQAANHALDVRWHAVKLPQRQDHFFASSVRVQPVDPPDAFELILENVLGKVVDVGRLAHLDLFLHIRHHVRVAAVPNLPGRPAGHEGTGDGLLVVIVIEQPCFSAGVRRQQLAHSKAPHHMPEGFAIARKTHQFCKPLEFWDGQRGLPLHTMHKAEMVD